jgi:hypothetical protein
MIKVLTTVLFLGWTLLSGQEPASVVQETAKQEKKIAYGKILEKKEVMGYDYLKVDENGKERWVAIAKAPVKVGERIGYDTRTVMKSFKSKSLGRTFKEIVFANEVYLPNHTPVIPSMKAALQPDIEKVASKDENVTGFTEKPLYTVEEVHRFRKMLNGKKVTVIASVYKVSRGIMKRDWVHLGDGTGNEKKLTDDLVFTASHTDLKAGDHVKARATIIVDKDFGYGYFYRVLGENASFVKQND